MHHAARFLFSFYFGSLSFCNIHFRIRGRPPACLFLLLLSDHAADLYCIWWGKIGKKPISATQQRKEVFLFQLRRLRAFIIVVQSAPLFLTGGVRLLLCRDLRQLRARSRLRFSSVSSSTASDATGCGANTSCQAAIASVRPISPDCFRLRPCPRRSAMACEGPGSPGL